MKEKLVIPASLKMKGLGITGEEKSWVDLCKSLGLDYKGQSAHRLVKTRYKDVHDAICKDCIYDKAKPVKAKAVKGESKPVKPVKAMRSADAITCYGCGASMPKNLTSTLMLPAILAGTKLVSGKVYNFCPNCVFGKLLA